MVLNGMNNRERFKSILSYENYDRIPVVNFGFWHETLWKWQKEGHITIDEVRNWQNGSEAEFSIHEKLGFEFNSHAVFGAARGVFPLFEEKILEELPGGFIKFLNKEGAILLKKPGTPSVPPVIDFLLKDRQSWEKIYLPRLRFINERINKETSEQIKTAKIMQTPLGLDCGSLYGQIRNWMGVENLCYLQADDEELLDEMINTIADLSYKNVEAVLSTGIKFDYGHFWEDICYKNGPLVTPGIFALKIGPHYRRITKLLNNNGIGIVSVDCDGLIDSLIPAWIDNGVNTMFPIEVGTWNANIRPWREKYSGRLRGIGGMNKNVFARDRTAIDNEIERLKPLVDLGGFLPCPDHNIPPDAEWDNVKYYCEKMRKTFGG